MFIWDFVANPVMESILDWFYSQMVGFLGAFFAQMGNMGVELFDLSWVRSVVRFFSQLGWALFAVSVVVSAFECGIEYASGRGNLQQPALNALKGFFAVIHGVDGIIVSLKDSYEGFGKGLLVFCKQQPHLILLLMKCFL